MSHVSRNGRMVTNQGFKYQFQHLYRQPNWYRFYWVSVWYIAITLGTGCVFYWVSVQYIAVTLSTGCVLPTNFSLQNGKPGMEWNLKYWSPLMPVEWCGLNEQSPSNGTSYDFLQADAIAWANYGGYIIFKACTKYALNICPF